MQPLDTTRRILTIDDNDAIHADFRKILGKKTTSSKLSQAKSMLFGEAPPREDSTRVHFEIDSALNGEDGLQKLKQAAVDGRAYCLAFVDMRMPTGWDGVQTIQQLWEVDPDLQVVICSAYSDYSWEAISEKLGVTDRLLIIKKPFDPAEVSQVAVAMSEKWMLRRAAKIKMEQLEEMVNERTRELTVLALHDKLTGLANRALFNERVGEAVARAKTSADYSFAILFLDFDRFKIINDSLGHEAGDRVLQGIAGRLTAALDLAGSSVGNAIAARLGGDEFTILIDGDPSLDATEFAAKLLQLLGGVYVIDHHSVHCTASIGLTSSRLQYDSAEHAMRDADTAMYHAKAAGKARYVVFDRKMHEAALARLTLENDLRHAIELDQLLLHFQPIISLSSGRTRGFEALVRWQHPQRGLVAPLEFIPCAEEIGLIQPIGIWILNAACRQLKIWSDRFPDRPLTMSVNVSALQLTATDFVKEVSDAIERTNINASQLILELTESAMISDAESSIDVMNRLRALGVSLHLDDFGTGYSSLSALHRFPLSGLKIDRSFVATLGGRHDYVAVVNAIISLAKHLGMALIAEGIETASQIALLQSMDCDLAQGFYFSRPVDAKATEAFIKSSSSFSFAA